MISYTLAVFRCVDEHNAYLVDLFEDTINTHRTILRIVYICDYYQMDVCSFFEDIRKFRIEGCKYRLTEQKLYELLIFYNYQMRLDAITNKL